MSSNVPIRACAVCARILDHADGAGYMHMISDGHVVVPVVPSEIRTDYRCDFCTAPHPTWVLPADSFKVAGIPAGSDGGWSACEACADLLRADDWAGLVRRAIREYAVWAGHPMLAESRMFLAQTYRRLSSKVSGPLERIAR